jgi:hypothetical protein
VGAVDVVLTLYGRPPATLLAADLEDMDGVLSVIAEDPNVGDDLSIYPERTRLTPRPPLPPAAGGNQ